MQRFDTSTSSHGFGLTESRMVRKGKQRFSQYRREEGSQATSMQCCDFELVIHR